MRRTTLGPVSSSGLNARISMGAPPARNPRSNLGSFKTASDRRASAVPSLGGRRASAAPMHAGGKRTSSISGMRASMAYGSRPGGMRSDPRPSNDRSYMQLCVKNLISFVIDRGYDLPISPKILTNPSSKDFQSIFTFLIRQIDPTFSFQKRFEDEIPVLLKRLGYPFNISKSALSAVGSPHTWPALLGVLTWLLELLKFDAEDTARTETHPDLDAHQRRENIFCENMAEAYVQFLLGSDTFPELDATLERQFEQDDGLVREQVTSLEKSRVELSATLQALRAQPSPLRLATEHRASLESNIRKFKLLIPSLVDHRGGVQKKTAEKEEELSMLKRDIASVAEEKMEILQILERQEEAAIDVERIASDRDNLRDSLQKVDRERAVADDDQKAAEQDVATATRALSDALVAYHSGAETLLLIPSSANNAGGVEYGIALSRDASLTLSEDLLSQDPLRGVLPTIRDMKDACTLRICALQEEDLNLQDQVDEIEGNLLVKRDEVSRFESRNGKLERDQKAEKTAMAEQLKVNTDGSLMREEEIGEARRSVSESVKVSERRVDNLKNQLRAFEEQFARERGRVGAVLMQDAVLLRDHKVMVRDKINSVKEHFERASQSMSEDAGTGVGI